MARDFFWGYFFSFCALHQNETYDARRMLGGRGARGEGGGVLPIYIMSHEENFKIKKKQKFDSTMSYQHADAILKR